MDQITSAQRIPVYVSVQNMKDSHCFSFIELNTQIQYNTCVFRRLVKVCLILF